MFLLSFSFSSIYFAFNPKLQNGIFLFNHTCFFDFFFSFSAHFSSSEISRQNFFEIITLFFFFLFLNICPTHFECFLLGHHVFLFLHIQGLGLRSKPSPLGHSHGLWVCLPLPSCTEQRRETKLTFASWCLPSMKTSYFIQIHKKVFFPIINRGFWHQN